MQATDSKTNESSSSIEINVRGESATIAPPPSLLKDLYMP